MALCGQVQSTAELEVSRSHSRSVVTVAHATSPLRLLNPESPGHAAWVYQSSLGGGFVGNDAVALRVDVAAGAALFLSSQASSKVYRGTDSKLSLEATVGPDATLVAWPDPITCFAGATFEQTQRFRIARSSKLVVVDAWTAGRVAHGERWAFERLAMRMALQIDGTRVLDEAVLLSPRHGDLAMRFAGNDAFATIVVAGIATDLVARIAAEPLRGDPLVAASGWPWGVVVRIGAGSTELLANRIRALIGSIVSDALGADPWARKW